MYRKTVQTLGTGTTVNYFEREYNVNANSNVIQLSDCLNAAEFRTKAMGWQYMKLVSATVSLYPDQKATTTKWLMLWTGDDDSADNVEFSDSSKIMTTNTLRIQYRKWRVPNAVLPTGSNLSGHTAINLKDWIVIDDIGTYNSTTNTIDYSLPGRLAMRKYNTEYTRFRVTLQIVFRNAKYPSIQGIMNALKMQLNDEGKKKLDGLLKYKLPSSMKGIQPAKPVNYEENDNDKDEDV